MSVQKQSKIGVGYVRAPARWRKLPRFGSKKEYITGEYRDDEGNLHLRRNSASGYERWRSYEVDPLATHRKTDVSVAVSRLSAVAWCYPDDWSVGEILADMKGKDAHHSAPEADADRGIEWDNREDVVEMIGHGEHASITNTERRAYAETDKRRAMEPDDDVETCAECGEEGTLCVSEAFAGKRCPGCARDAIGSGSVEVLQ